jgi:hypothetical protein
VSKKRARRIGWTPSLFCRRASQPAATYIQQIIGLFSPGDTILCFHGLFSSVACCSQDYDTRDQQRQLCSRPAAKGWMRRTDPYFIHIVLVIEQGVDSRNKIAPGSAIVAPFALAADPRARQPVASPIPQVAGAARPLLNKALAIKKILCSPDDGRLSSFCRATVNVANPRQRCDLTFRLPPAPGRSSPSLRSGQALAVSLSVAITPKNAGSANR